jgi:hypothetical protein
MDYRVGTCASCKQSYRIPASFRHNQARCKNCGGVVSIAPLEAPPAATPRRSEPAAAAAPIAAVHVAPSEPVVPAPSVVSAAPAPPAPVQRAPIQKVVSKPAPPGSDESPRPRSNRLKLVAWAAAIALVAACWWAFSSEKSSTAADSLRADSEKHTEDPPRVGE